ncbi:hypothetical protein [Paenibacillus sp. CAA11]|uniref:hypothetical protein n=1 Tax=Paenibacillus sp. CAA11 TaxID=1532905 RepID=UPI001F16C29E|nr:hypothetical protein [Paenibacillus sp. CAA11]
MERRINYVLCILGALVAAIIGGFIWAGIAITTNYELGIIAWLIGGLTGFAVFFTSNKRASAATQLIAVIASLIGIILGKYFIFSYFLMDGFSGIADGEVIRFFIEAMQSNFSDMFGAMDIVFAVLAILTAWQLPRNMAAKRQAAENSQTVPAE